MADITACACCWVLMLTLLKLNRLTVWKVLPQGAAWFRPARACMQAAEPFNCISIAKLVEPKLRIWLMLVDREPCWKHWLKLRPPPIDTLEGGPCTEPRLWTRAVSVVVLELPALSTAVTATV
ncbi:Uncharacterised protein [uncultured archaeon]|nr:Uncharacterised protein [uncultured archaeon]